MAAPSPPVPLRVEVLGPLRLLVDSVAVDVPGPKRRALLALLAVAEGRTVPLGSLVEALWPSETPGSGRQAMHTHVSRLRAHLGAAADRLRTEQVGYRLDLGTDGLDVAEVRQVLRRARHMLPGQAVEAYRELRRADALWRGPALADLRDVVALAAFLEECTHLQREVTDALIAAGIAAGRAEEVLGRAATALAADPLREPAVLLTMRSLAETGEPHEALRAGRDFRRRLADESGLDPSPALAALEREIAGGGSGSSLGPEVPARPTTALVGRADEVAALHRMLAGERLVTLVGPGGVGKTRLALEVARDSDATVLLLAPLADREGSRTRWRPPSGSTSSAGMCSPPVPPSWVTGSPSC